MNLNELAKKVNDLKTNRATLNRQVADLEIEIKEVEADIFDAMTQQGVSRFANDEVSISLKIDTLPTVKDWDAVYAYIANNDAFYLLQRRLKTTAVAELREAGEALPGIEYLETPSLSYRSV
jgi:outer membrane murein-binding lipoprotein Lpp